MRRMEKLKSFASKAGHFIKKSAKFVANHAGWVAAAVVGTIFIPKIALPFVGAFAAYQGTKYGINKYNSYIDSHPEKGKKFEYFGFGKESSDKDSDLGNNISKVVQNSEITAVEVKALVMDEANSLCRAYGWDTIEDCEELDIFFEELHAVFKKYNSLNLFYSTMSLLVKYVITKALDEHKKGITIRDLFDNANIICCSLESIPEMEILEAQKRMVSRFKNIERPVALNPVLALEM